MLVTEVTNMKESIINYLKEHGKSSVNDIAQALNHAGGEKFPQLIKAISAMEVRDSCVLTEMALYPCVLRKKILIK